MAKLRSEAVWFESAAEWRAWLETNHATAGEIWLGLSKKHVDAGVVYEQALDEALCFGWIDGITHSVDADGYTVRFTPRKPTSAWSAVNLANVERLRAAGRMHAAGLRAWEDRDPGRVTVPVKDRGYVDLDPDQLARFQERPEAWEWFQTRPPGYRKQALWWVQSAKRPETRDRRLAALIDASARGEKIRELA